MSNITNSLTIRRFVNNENSSDGNSIDEDDDEDILSDNSYVTSNYSEDSLAEFDRKINMTPIDNIFKNENFINEKDKKKNYEIIKNDIPKLLNNIKVFTDYMLKKNDNLSENYSIKYYEREKELNKIILKKEIKMKNEYNNKLKELEKEKNNFHILKKKWEELNESDLKIKNNEIINLNVGGIIYTTKFCTLLSEKFCFFYKIFKNKDNWQKDKNGNYFIDRDGESFRYILNWLRDKNSVHFPRKRSKIYPLLKNDVKFYKLKKLERILNFSPNRFEEDDYVICNCENDLYKKIICIYKHSDSKNHYHISNYWKYTDNDMKHMEIKSYEDEIKKYDMNCEIYFTNEETCGEYFCYDIENEDECKDYISNIKILNDTCSICLKNFEVNQWIHKTICNHLFHINCLNKWILKNSEPNCPNCRKKILKIY
jgi:hypothetical protein